MDKPRRFSHNIGIRHLLIVLCLLVISQDVTSRDYRIQTLRTAALKLGLEQQIEQAATGATSILTTQNGQTVAVRISERGRVEHIGLPLFNDAMRQQKPSPVYDLLEYAALDRNIILTENDLQLQKIQFFKGSWSSLMDVLPTDACSLGTVSDKFYQVVWGRNDNEIINLVIPIDYELLSNSSRRELETNLVREMGSQHVRRPSFHLVEELLQRTENDSIYVLPGEFFLMKSLTRNTYYRMSLVSQHVDDATYEEERMSILVDQDYPAETMANLLVSADPQIPDAAMQLDVQFSSYVKETMNVTLRQWTSYCENQGCKAFFIFDDIVGPSVKGYLLMHNEAMGYNHLLVLTCSMDDLTSEIPLFTGKAMLYIPNVEASKLLGSEDDVETNKKRFR